MPKIVSGEEAIKEVKSGDRVFLPEFCAKPQTLVEALVAEKERLEKVELVIDMQPLGKCEYAEPEMRGHFFILCYTPTKILGEAFKRNQGEYLPCHLSQFEKLVSDGYLPIDAALIQLSPPDENGYCSLGTSVLYYKEVMENAGVVIAEINDQVPRTLGDCLVHLSQIDYMVETSQPLVERQLPDPDMKSSSVEHKIGENIAELIPDGATIQVGVGLPERVFPFLKEKKNLGVHSGMIVDGMVDLMENRVINNRHKNIDTGASVATCIAGTKRLFDFVHRNPSIKMMPSSYTHSSAVISQIDSFVAINAAVQVDLTGQINSEVVPAGDGSLRVGGTGGLMDFVRCASLSLRGKSIIVLSSTARRGKLSRIVPRVNTVTCPRSDAHYVVTEHGIADLRGKTIKQRAKALMDIASSDFRDELEAYLKKNLY
jgi:4-hydroxybutyrate CoA-transferase